MSGQTDQHAGGFRSASGQLVQGQEAIIPILKTTDDPRTIKCIGTGFFISNSGIFATAAHVLRDVIDHAGNQSADLRTIQFVPPNSIAFRSVVKIALHPTADVAIGALATHRHPETNEPITNRMLVLTRLVPPPSAQIATWAYPNCRTEYDPGRLSLLVRPTPYFGQLVREYRAGRDRVLLPAACYETDLAIEGGASGGPVFDCRGRVFALNSTSFDGCKATYISHIQSIGGLPIGPYQTEDGVIHQGLTIHDLIARGHVCVDDNLEVVADRGEDRDRR